ncbi:T9SS type A sorting domain-containing protein, partial [Candidatus Poribacteria bacterium]|nr:T9SS type A sorting domain-containing protein [Candidatus Poribacteria bacterium]
ITFSGKYELLPQYGSITVNTNLDEAAFSISGPENYSGSGKTFEVTQAPVGEYTITYGDIVAYITPPSETKILAVDSNITFNVTYEPVPKTGSIVVNTNHDSAEFYIVGPGNHSGSGKSFSIDKTPVGNYTIYYRHVDNHKTPVSQTKSLAQDSTITFTGVYEPIPTSGSLTVNTNLDSAAFHIIGPRNYIGTGKSFSVDETPIGEYTINYQEVEGYITPITEVKILTEDSSIVFNGNYMPKPDTGEIVVNTNLDKAIFNITGPDNYSGDGLSFTVNQALVGDYTIQYQEVEGYITPPSQTKTLSKDGTINFIGKYNIPQKGIIVVVTNLDEAAFDISGPDSYSGTGKSYSVNSASTGEYTIIYHHVEGYETPPSQTLALDENSEISFIGNYKALALTGSIVVNTNLDQSSYIISGPESYTGNGKSYSVEQVPIGNYIIEYQPVDGYKTPESESFEVTGDSSVILDTEYVSLTQAQQVYITINLKDAKFSLSGPSGYMNSTITTQETENAKTWTLTGAPTGEYTIRYLHIEGYEEPTSETKILDTGGTVSFLGEYEPVSSGIQEVYVSESVAKAGDTIVVNVQGITGGSAIFSVIGVVNDVIMTESQDSPGFYTGEYTVPQGVNAKNATVIVKLTSPAGVVLTNDEENITIDSVPPRIEFVEVHGIPARKPGDIITVTLKGEPGGTANFAISGLDLMIQMPESKKSPGIYMGSYTAVEGLNVKETKVIVTLMDNIGNDALDETATASIITAPWDVNQDGVVDISDLSAVASRMYKPPVDELDVNGDGVMNVLDLALVGRHFGEQYGPNGGLIATDPSISDPLMAPNLLSCYVYQNYPNPCNPGTWIPFVLTRPQEVTLSIYSSSGRLIRKLELGYRQAGLNIGKDKAAYWDGNNEVGEDVVSGIYFYNLKAGNFSVTRKMIVTR